MIAEPSRHRRSADAPASLLVPAESRMRTAGVVIRDPEPAHRVMPDERVRERVDLARLPAVVRPDGRIEAFHDARVDLRRNPRAGRGHLAGRAKHPSNRHLHDPAPAAQLVHHGVDQRRGRNQPWRARAAPPAHPGEGLREPIGAQDRSRTDRILVGGDQRGQPPIGTSGTVLPERVRVRLTTRPDHQGHGQRRFGLDDRVIPMAPVSLIGGVGAVAPRLLFSPRRPTAHRLAPPAPARAGRARDAAPGRAPPAGDSTASRSADRPRLTEPSCGCSSLRRDVAPRGSVRSSV